MRAKVAAAPGDAASAVTLADALLRQTRVSGNAGLASEAERVLGAVLERDAERYDARRMLAATYLSQHRFSEALREAQRCRTMRPDDAWSVRGHRRRPVERGDATPRSTPSTHGRDQSRRRRRTRACHARASCRRSPEALRRHADSHGATARTIRVARPGIRQL
jgi:hypothetical protein